MCERGVDGGNRTFMKAASTRKWRPGWLPL